MFGSLYKKENVWKGTVWFISYINPKSIEEDIPLLEAPLALPEGVFIEDVLFVGNVVEFEIVDGFAKIINIKSEDYPNPKLKDAYKNFNNEIESNKEVLKITLKEYGYHCPDGCCYNYGTICRVNNIELPSHNQDTATILQQVLEHLGYKVEIEQLNDFE